MNWESLNLQRFLGGAPVAIIHAVGSPFFWRVGDWGCTLVRCVKHGLVFHPHPYLNGEFPRGFLLHGLVRIRPSGVCSSRILGSEETDLQFVEVISGVVFLNKSGVCKTLMSNKIWCLLFLVVYIFFKSIVASTSKIWFSKWLIMIFLFKLLCKGIHCNLDFL